MAYREVSRMEIPEIIRRWQAGAGPRQIATGTGLSRNTVRKYLAAAKAEGALFPVQWIQARYTGNRQGKFRALVDRDGVAPWDSA